MFKYYVIDRHYNKEEMYQLINNYAENDLSFQQINTILSNGNVFNNPGTFLGYISSYINYLNPFKDASNTKLFKERVTMEELDDTYSAREVVALISKLANATIEADKTIVVKEFANHKYINEQVPTYANSTFLKWDEAVLAEKTETFELVTHTLNHNEIVENPQTSEEAISMDSSIETIIQDYQ